ncbi:hypothetical protein ACVLD2_003865 [Paenibacillus sp. PvR052]|nr:hypothetical protein [Paenibacillus sp. PvP091]MBP1171718.1 hypothetical protein [Paenibacillus sp. PvR098]MBP2438099.1 hypothetical protein [Paenibacillus sp. PvP052]
MDTHIVLYFIAASVLLTLALPHKAYRMAAKREL